MPSHFDLTNNATYQKWRKEKLDYFESAQAEKVISMENPNNMREGEISDIKSHCYRFNFALYQSSRNITKQELIVFCRQLGLKQVAHNTESDEHGVSDIRETTNSHYIPYTNKALNWHTDGYYNTTECQISAFVLHCQNAAAKGGMNKILDPEIAYILLRDKHPEYITALMQSDALTIPENEIQPSLQRLRSTGPVFSITMNNELNTRYTARRKSIEWADRPWLIEARLALTDILNTSNYVFHCKLTANQGIISNNALHSRTAFTNSHSQFRLVHRLRFFDRIN